MIKQHFTLLNKKKQYFYVVAVSGGPDSMFLLDKMRTNGYSFVVCHVNYKKRVDSDYDESVVFNYCKSFAIVFFSYHPKHNDSGNFQANARKQRYNFFFETADKFATKQIVIAHNFEDSLETYLMQKERNCFVNHWGLREITSFNNYLIIRPMLTFTKKQILDYLKKNNIEYAIDQSNSSSEYRRNVVRRKLFSLSSSDQLKIYNESIEDNLKLKIVLSNFIETLRSVVDYDLIKLNNEWIVSSSEVQMRIIYQWINDYSTNSFVQNKKGVIREIRKQLLSKKGRITIMLNNKFEIKKIDNLAIISKGNIWKTKIQNH